jgi:hypothetical protein
MKTVGFYVAALSSVKAISGRCGRYAGCEILHRDDMREGGANARTRARKEIKRRTEASKNDSCCPSPERITIL